MKACQECGGAVVLKNETRLWKAGGREVLLHGIDVYRCEAGHDYLVIPQVSALVELVSTHPDHRSYMHVPPYMSSDEALLDPGGWTLYGGSYGPLGQELYVVEERELPDGDWVCSDLLGFDTADEAAEAMRKESLSLDQDCPKSETRVVLYERREVVRFINKDGVVSKSVLQN